MSNNIIDKNNLSPENKARIKNRQKEIIHLVKQSINDGIEFQNNFYNKIINYLKNKNPELSAEMMQLLNKKNILDNYEENEDEKENNKNMINTKGRYNNNNGYDNNKKRKPLRQIYKSNYNDNNAYNGQNDL